MILRSHPSDAQAWTAAIAPGRMLALPAYASARFDGVTETLAGPEGFRAALELLLADGIASAPPFALIDGDSTVARVVIRGEAVVEVTAGDRDAAGLTITGRDVATWSERVLEGARRLRVQVPGSTWTLVLDSPTAATTGTSPAAASVGETTLVPANPAPPDPTAVEPYDFLFGDTIYRTQAGVDVRIPNPDPDRPGDHDGSTMLAGDLGLGDRVNEVRREASPESVPEWKPAPRADSRLQLERADGSREPLLRPVLIGRAPRVSAAAAASGPQPRLVTIADDQDISRSHLRVAVEGDAVVVTDLASKNGTVVTLPGAAPRKLRAKEATVVLPGTVIDLGGGITFTVRED